jgi:hypothetical protein
MNTFKLSQRLQVHLDNAKALLYVGLRNASAIEFQKAAELYLKIHSQSHSKSKRNANRTMAHTIV